jgi:hypothetical protein
MDSLSLCLKNKQKYYSGNIFYMEPGLQQRILGKVLFERILTFKNPHNLSLYNHFEKSHNTKYSGNIQQLSPSK